MYRNDCYSIVACVFEILANKDVVYLKTTYMYVLKTFGNTKTMKLFHYRQTVGQKVADGRLSLQIVELHQKCHNYLPVWEVLIKYENTVIDLYLRPNNKFVQW